MTKLVATERGLGAAVRRELESVSGWTFYRSSNTPCTFGGDFLVAMPPPGTKPGKLHVLACVLQRRGVSVSVGLTPSRKRGHRLRAAILLRAPAKAG